MKVSISYRVGAPWEKLGEVLCHKDYNVEADKLREGVVSTRFEMLEDGDQRKRFKTYATEYKRKKTGGLDRSSTVETWTDYKWDAGSRTLSWDYHGEDERFKLGGVYRLTPEGSATRLTHDVTVEVNIPLIGGMLTKMVSSEFEKPDPRYQRLMDKYLKKL